MFTGHPFVLEHCSSVSEKCSNEYNARAKVVTISAANFESNGVYISMALLFSVYGYVQMGSPKRYICRMEDRLGKNQVVSSNDTLYS